MARKPEFFLRQWRKHRDMTQEDLAARLETSAATISRWETGKVNFTGEGLAQLAEALDCEPGDLFRDPNRPDYQAWRIIHNMAPEQRDQAVRILEALVAGSKAA